MERIVHNTIWAETGGYNMPEHLATANNQPSTGPRWHHQMALNTADIHWILR